MVIFLSDVPTIVKAPMVLLDVISPASSAVNLSERFVAAYETLLTTAIMARSIIFFVFVIFFIIL